VRASERGTGGGARGREGEREREGGGKEGAKRPGSQDSSLSHTGNYYYIGIYLNYAN
jgi:hypothetical protein